MSSSPGRWSTPAKLWNRLKPAARKMRKEPTPAEEQLWQLLRKKPFGMRARRQHPIERFVVDYFIPQARLVIELDGEIHQKQKTEDQARESFLKENGYRVIRFSNQDVLQNCQQVLESIKAAALD